MRRLEDLILNPGPAAEVRAVPQAPSRPRIVPRHLEEESVSMSNLSAGLRASIGRFFEAEEFPGQVGEIVEDPGASGGRALRALSSGPEGFIIVIK